MAYLSDTQRIELALPSRLLRHCWEGIITGIGSTSDAIDQTHAQMTADLFKCCDEPLSDLLPKDAQKLRRKIDRVLLEAMEPYVNDRLSKISLMVMYWVSDRIECGDLILHENSLFDSCFTRLRDALGEHEDIWNGVNKSAAKQARKLHERLRGLGYYARS